MTRPWERTTRAVRTASTIAELQLRRLVRQPLNAFWLVVAPLLFVLVLGVLLGGGQDPRLAVVHDERDPIARELVAALVADGRFEVARHAEVDALREAVERGTAQAGVVIPSALTEAVRHGEQATITLVIRPGDPRGADWACGWRRWSTSRECWSARPGSPPGGARARCATTSPGRPIWTPRG